MREPFKSNLLKSIKKIQGLLDLSELKPSSGIQIKIIDHEIIEDELVMVLFSLKFSVYTDNYLGDVAQHIKEIEEIIGVSMTRFSINNDGNLISTSKGYGLTYGGILVDSMNYSHQDVALNFVLDVMYIQ